MENNLSYYKIFYTVAKAQNISKAAKELYISQPAISKAIAKLEQNLNTILFTRNSRGVRLTYEGELLFKECKIAFSALANGEIQVKNAMDLNMGNLRIGVSTTLCKYILLPYLKRFMMKYPLIQISIECAGTYEIVKLLEEGDIDIGLVAKPSQLSSLQYFKMGNIQDIFVASPHYIKRIYREKKVDIDTNIWNASTIMLLDKGNITRQHVDSYFLENNISQTNLLEVTSMDLLIEFAKIGIGVACVIEDFVKEEIKNGSLLEVKNEVPIPAREIGFVCNSMRSMPKALTFFLNMMK